VPGEDQDNEVELARRLLAGDAQAFECFVEHFSAKIFHYSWMMCGVREDAEEVAQETLLKVFESSEQLREPEKVRSWVFRIAKNACLSKRRKSIFAPSRELSLDELMPAKRQDGEGVQIEIADWSLLPEGQAIRGEMNALLERAIRELPEIYRSVILMRDIEELTTLETAEILEVSPDTIKTRLHRARLAVRLTIDKYLRGEGNGEARIRGAACA